MPTREEQRETDRNPVEIAPPPRSLDHAATDPLDGFVGEMMDRIQEAFGQKNETAPEEEDAEH